MAKIWLEAAMMIAKVIARAMTFLVCLTTAAAVVVAALWGVGVLKTHYPQEAAPAAAWIAALVALVAAGLLLLARAARNVRTRCNSTECRHEYEAREARLGKAGRIVLWVIFIPVCGVALLLLVAR